MPQKPWPLVRIAPAADVHLDVVPVIEGDLGSRRRASRSAARCSPWSRRRTRRPSRTCRRAGCARLWRRDARRRGPVPRPATILVKDFKGRHDVAVALATADMGEAVRGAELIVCPAPGIAQADIARALAPHLDGQVVFLPPGTFGSFVMSRSVRGPATAPTWPWPRPARCRGSRASTGRSRSRSRCARSACRPASSRWGAAHALAVIARAFPGRDRGCGDALSGALMNAGPIIHPPLIIMNAAPLEHFERWDIHKEGTQPAIRRVTDALDAERIAVREALGYGAPHYPLADHYARTARSGCTAAARTRSPDRFRRLARAHRAAPPTATYSRTPSSASPSSPRSARCAASRRRSRTACWRSAAASSARILRTGRARSKALGLGSSIAPALQQLLHDGVGERGAAIAASAPAAWAAASPSCSPMPATPSRWSTSSRAAGAVWRAARRGAAEIRGSLTAWRALGAFDESDRSTRSPSRAVGRCRGGAPAALAAAAVIFEGVPARRWRPSARRSSEISRALPRRRDHHLDHEQHPGDAARAAVRASERFLNMHWLNPAYLIPVVELSRQPGTERRRAGAHAALMEGIGKLPVVCGAAPGYIVPRLQALMMNEAARMVEEGVATAEEIDKATRYGLGPALRRDRRGGVHRLRRRRHPASRQPRDGRLDRCGALCRAGDRGDG